MLFNLLTLLLYKLRVKEDGVWLTISSQFARKSFVLLLTLKTTRSCSPSCRTVPSSFIRRTKAMAKFFSLLSLAGGDECVKKRRERENSGMRGGKTADLCEQVCVQ